MVFVTEQCCIASMQILFWSLMTKHQADKLHEGCQIGTSFIILTIQKSKPSWEILKLSQIGQSSEAEFYNNNYIIKTKNGSIILVVWFSN